MNHWIDSIWTLFKRLLRVALICAVALLVLCVLVFIATLGLLAWLILRISGRKPQHSVFMRFQQTANAWGQTVWTGRSPTTTATTDAQVVDVQARELDAAPKHLR